MDNQNIDKILREINFYDDDGVCLIMINDFFRNQFYDSIFESNVKNKKCLDIGFGTGLLSILAIKHGASHITSYESDTNRYKLGCEIIKLLNLQNYITLINQRYTRDIKLHNIDVILSETIDCNLWTDGMYLSVCKNTNIQYLPEKYFLEVYSQNISEQFANSLIKPSLLSPKFIPGIHIDNKFELLINLLLCKKYHLLYSHKNCINLTSGIINFDLLENSLTWEKYILSASSYGNCIGKYIFDANSKQINGVSIDMDEKTYSIKIDTSEFNNKTVLIVPRVGMIHQDKKIYLDTGHWGPAKWPIILHNPQKNLIVTHDLYSGEITYSLE